MKQEPTERPPTTRHQPHEHGTSRRNPRPSGRGGSQLTYQSGWGPNDYRAQLTKAGKAAFMKSTYLAPVLDPTCRSFYLGPKTHEHRVDCNRARHGEDKKHRADWFKSKDGRVVETVVKWSDDEARGRASARYGAEIRAADQDSAGT